MMLENFETISLEEMLNQASLLTRVDRKYLLEEKQLGNVLGSLGQLQVLEIGAKRLFPYSSVYFDTPDLLSYRLAATRRRRRFKVRTRLYEDSNECFLEVKTRHTRGQTVKTRINYPASDAMRLNEEGFEFVKNVLEEKTGRRLLTELHPVLRNSYQRSTLYAEVSHARVTLDFNLTWRGSEVDRHVNNLVILETKTPPGELALDRMLWRQGVRPVSISKYGVGVATTNGKVPANKWARLIQSYQF